MKNYLHLFALTTGLTLLFALPATAADAPAVAVFGNYMDDFIAYWKEKAMKQNTIVVAVLLVGAVALLIITRSKGPK